MLSGDLKGYKIILASGSPRRKELLEKLGLKFEVLVKSWEENYPAGLKGKDIALYLASAKAEHMRSEIADNVIVIAADTIVWCKDKTLDKPSDREEALDILKEISGNTHEVITGVCILSRNRKTTFFCSTKVTFNILTDEEMQYYVEKYEPYDKAGAYGIQEWIGVAACSRIEGSFFNVVGLPSDMLYAELKKFIKQTPEPDNI